MDEEYTQEQSDQMIKSMQEQAAYFQKLQEARPKFIYHTFNMGWSTLSVRFLPGKYDLCPCESGEKYNNCCKQFN